MSLVVAPWPAGRDRPAMHRNHPPAVTNATAAVTAAATIPHGRQCGGRGQLVAGRNHGRVSA